MKILVIGSEGNIGRRLVPYLTDKNHTVYCIDQVQGYRANYDTINIMQSGDLQRVFFTFRPEMVVLLAGMVSRVTCEKSPTLAVDTNLSGLNNVIQLCRWFNATLMYFSTSEVYGNIHGLLTEDRKCQPNNLYGVTKYLGEHLVSYFTDLSFIIVRPFMFYDEDETIGDNRSAMIRFAYNLSRKQKIQVHAGSRRSWLHMNDAVRILESIMTNKRSYFQTINIGSEDVILTELLALKMCQRLDVPYYDYVEELPLPDKMTLDKVPDLRIQRELTGMVPTIDIDKGIDLVLNKIKERK